MQTDTSGLLAMQTRENIRASSFAPRGDANRRENTWRDRGKCFMPSLGYRSDVRKLSGKLLIVSFFCDNVIYQRSRFSRGGKVRNMYNLCELSCMYILLF